MKKYVITSDGSVVTPEYYKEACEPKTSKCSSFSGFAHSHLTYMSDVYPEGF